MIGGMSFETPQGSWNRETAIPSLDGDGYIGGHASTRFLGEEFPGTGGKLGTFFWTGDINGDGLEDLCIGASDAPGKPDSGKEHTGHVYVWYGNASGLPASVDLGTDPPDILIKGGHEGSYMPNSMDVGDLDGDGFADLILGIPLQDTCGRVYILWGSDEGWPEVIDLYDPGRLSPNGDPYGFLRTDEFMIIAGHIAPVPLPDGNYYVGNGVAVRDLDRDGMADLIFSSPGSNHIVVLWGKWDRYDLGTELTVIEDDDETGRFGETFEIDDIDDDGWPDVVVSAPHGSNRSISKYECGTVHLIFNISRSRGSDFQWTSEITHTRIWGGDAYDRLGRELVLEDINDDRYPDMIIGCPDADGPSNSRSGAGAIHIFLGGSKAKFPLHLTADVGADRTIHGARGEGQGVPGDSVGGSYSVGDIDADGEKELILGLRYALDDRGIQTGAVAGYETNVVFTPATKIVDLRNCAHRFGFWGGTYLDILGYRVHTGDINGDGSEEVLVGAPSGDGDDDIRVNAGEAFVLSGSNISISDLRFAGEAVVASRVLPSKGHFFLNLTFRHSDDPSRIDEVRVILAPGLIDGILSWSDGIFSYIGPSVVSVDPENCSRTLFSKTVRLSFKVFIGWYSDLGRPWDVRVILTEMDGFGVSRDFPTFLPISNIVRLGQEATIKSDGRILYPGEWLSSGSDLEIGPFQLTYENSGWINVNGDGFRIELYRNGSLIDSRPFEGATTILRDILPGERIADYEVRASFTGNPPPGEWPGEGPMITGAISFSFNIDNVVPRKPRELKLIPDIGRISSYDDDPNWFAEWKGELGPEMDGNTSGIKGYMIKVNGEEYSEVRTAGGLRGSYYDGFDLQHYKYGEIDQVIDFGNDDWGVFGPNVNELTSADFSVRWHGWFRADSSRTYQFYLSGDGVARLTLGSEVIIDWSDISTMRNSRPFFMDEGSFLPIIIHYYNEDPPGPDCSSSIFFRYMNDIGAIVPVDKDLLYYPGNRTMFSIEGSETFNFSVASVDWVQISSAPISTRGYIDNAPPVIDLSGIPRWYGTTQPGLTVGFRDPMIGSESGSGIDTASIEYRMKERTDDTFSPWTSQDTVIETVLNGSEAPLDIISKFGFSLSPGWRGSIQWRVSDIVGNMAESSILDIGIDRQGPVFELLSPNLQISQKEGEIGFLMKANDRPGSGIDPASMEWRYRVLGEWTEWKAINISGSGEEIVFDVSGIFPPGNNQVQFRCEDIVGNVGYSETYNILTESAVSNLPPLAVIRSPLPGTQIRIGSPLTLDGSDSSDDGEGAFPEIRFTWVSNIDGYLGSGEVITVYLSYIGEHRIRLFVDDGTPGHNVSTEVNVTVRPGGGGGGNITDNDIEEDEKGLLTAIIIGVILVLALLVLVILLIRRSNNISYEQTRLDYVERTDDDLEYEEMGEEEDLGFIGSHVRDEMSTGYGKWES